MKLSRKDIELILDIINKSDIKTKEVVELKSKLEEDSKEEVILCHIGGYELLRDGTLYDSYNDINLLKEELDSWEIEYDNSINNITELAESIEEQWEDLWDDGGGSGWIEYEN